MGVQASSHRNLMASEWSIVAAKARRMRITEPRSDDGNYTKALKPVIVTNGASSIFIVIVFPMGAHER